MKRLSLAVCALALLLVLAPPARAGALAEQVKWIGSLAGVTLTSTDESSSKLEQTFMIQSPDRVLRQVRDGLKQRGWTLSGKGTLDSGAGASIQGFAAHKDGMQLEVAVQDAGIVCAMGLSLRARGDSSSSSSSESFEVGNGGGVTQAGDSLVFTDSNLDGTYECKGSRVSLNSSNNDLRFTGRCTSITLNGSNNQIVVDAACPRITINGSNNEITWSSRANPQGIDIQDNGAHNEILRRN